MKKWNKWERKKEWSFINQKKSPRNNQNATYFNYDYNPSRDLGLDSNSHKKIRRDVYLLKS